MSGFQVSVKEKLLVAVSTEGLEVLSVVLNGDLKGSQLSSLDVSGGYFNDEEIYNHLIWLNNFELFQNDKIEISFSESIITSHPGKTINELYPNSEEQMGPWEPEDVLFQKLAQKPNYRDKVTFQIEMPNGEIVNRMTNKEDFCYGLTSIWNWKHPTRAVVWLTSNSLAKIKLRENGIEHARTKLQYEQQIKVQIGT